MEDARMLTMCVARTFLHGKNAARWKVIPTSPVDPDELYPNGITGDMDAGVTVRPSINVIVGYASPEPLARLTLSTATDEALRETAHLELVVPFKTPKGRPVSHAQLEQMILSQATGYTAYDATGAWRDEETGELLTEPTRKYEITLGRNCTLRDIRALQEYVRTTFEQKAVYIEVTPTLATEF